MRKWAVLIDVTILITALLILIIDWQIKADIITQAKSLQVTIDGQRAETTGGSSSSLPGDLLRDHVPDNSAVASEASPKPRPRRNSKATGNAGKTVGSGGNADPGIPAESE